MQKTILTRFFSRSQFLIWGLAIFGIFSFQGNAFAQCATVNSTAAALVNPGFEDGADGWLEFFNGAGVDAIQANTGTSHARLVDPSIPAGFNVPGFFQTLPAVEGEVWTASFQVMTPVGNPITGSSFGLTQLAWRDANGNVFATNDSPQFNVGNSTPGVYQTVEVTATAPPGTMSVSVFGLFIDFPNETGELYYDDGVATSSTPLCGYTYFVAPDENCNVPFLTVPQLDIDLPAGCTLVSNINDFNGTDNASGVYPIGVTTVNFDVVDSDGTTPCSFTVDVAADMTPPVADCGGVFNPGFDVNMGWGAAGGANPFDTNFGNNLPGGSGAPMAVLFNAGQNFGVIFQGGIPSFEGEQITAGFAGFLPASFAGSGSFGAIKLEFIDANGIEILEIETPIFFDNDPTEVWMVRTADFVAPAGTVTVTIVPVFVGPSSAILVDDIVYENSMSLYRVDNNNSDCEAFVDLFEFQATDACGMVTVSNDFNGAESADDFYPLGETVVVTTFEDEAGNTASCTQRVINDPGGECAEASIADPCVCLDNATDNTDGQFGELVEVNGSTGDIWQVSASNGLYVVDANDASVQATPGVVYPLFPVTGVQLVENPAGSGVFQLAGVHVDAVGYMVTVRNLFTGQELTIGQTCNYPNVAATGLDDFNNACLADGTFDFSLSPNVAGQLDVTVDGTSEFSGAVAANSNNAVSVDVAALGTGTYVIEVSFDADDAAAPNPGCAVTYNYSLTVGEPQGTLTCNDHIQVSLDQTCEVTLTPDMILEGTYTGAFDLEIAGVAGNVLNGSHVGDDFMVTVTDACGDNSCWSMVAVEDKLAPTIACVDVVTICTEDIDDVAQPSALDNCDPNPTVQLIENVLGDDDACDDGQVVFVQTYVAIDNQGNQSAPCQRTVTVVRPAADQVDFPDDLVWSCDQYDGHPNIIAPERVNQSILNGFGTTYQLFDNTDAWDLTVIPTTSSLLNSGGSGIPTEIDGLYCQYGYTHADDVVATCGLPASTDSPVFKIIRTWTVLDWCTGTIVTGNPNSGEDNVQVIKVIDIVEPTVTGADQDVSANIPGAHPQPCTGQGPIALGTATDNCTGAENIQGFVYADAGLNSAVAQVVPVGNSDFGLITPALPVGCYFLVWTAEDACGNVGQSTTYDLCIEDDIVPVAVCDEITQVALSSDGLAVVYAETFDDGSYDNCCLDRMEVRRMSQTCGVLGNTTFDNDGHPNDSNSDPDDGEFVTFCCTDLDNDENIVVLRVFDCDGNYNECMVEVLLEDKLAPTITCPPNNSLTCDEYADDLAAALLACTDGGFAVGGFANEDECQSAALTAAGYGDAVGFDNCSVTITPTVTVTIDQCGAGSVVRSFVAQDSNPDNAPASCTQTITITHVSDWVVEFPADQDGFCDQAEPEFGEPEIFFETCELVATSFEDQFFDIVPDACFKIVRTWTVINWCVVGNEIDQEANAVELSEQQLNQDLNGDGQRNNRTFRDSWRGGPGTQDNDPDVDPWDGYITYQQVIKIIDDEAPIIDPLFAVNDQCIIDGDGVTCTFSGVLPTPEYDDCTLDVNGNLDSNGNIVDNELVITATVFDANGDIVSNSVVVSDLEEGCYVVRYVATDRCGNTTATDYDFCVNDCKFPTPYCKDGLVLELMHVDDPNNPSPAPMVELWASDLDAGSFDNCPGGVELSFSETSLVPGMTYTCDNLGENSVNLYVTDAAGNTDFCTTFVIIQANQGQCGSQNPLVAAAGTIANENNETVEEVTVEMSGQSNGMNLTTVDGAYSFDVPTGNDITITPSNDLDHDNGVTTFDLVVISKHILGSEALSTPYKMIAADANNSGTISTLDLVQIRKLILQIDTEFANNTSWRFVDKDFDFPNATNPWATAFPEVININNIDAAALANDFVAIKIGDVNASAATNNNLLGADDRSAGKLVIAAADRMVKAGETVTVDFTTVEAVQGYQFTLNFNNALDFVSLDNGTATEENFGFTLLSERAITASWNGDAVANDAAFSMTFTANADIMLSDALNINSRYTAAEAYNTNNELLDVELNFNATAVATFELYQNTPNPFKGETTIGFNLAEAGAATLTIADVSGRVLTVVEGDYAKGYNQVTVSNLPATGVMYYTLETANETATKKMVATK